MNVKTWIPLSAAVVLGSGAAYAGFTLVGQQRVKIVTKAVEMSDLVVASRGVAAGTMLTAEDLSVLSVSAKSMPVGFVAAVDAAVGRVTVDALRPGQAIGESLLAAPGTPDGLAGVLPRGYRAITLEFDRFAGVREFLKPEARVDVVSGFREGEEMTVQTVAQNLRVLAVGGLLAGQDKPDAGEDAERTSSSESPHSVTLMVTLEQAAAIELATVLGKPRLTLRAGGDAELSPFEGLTLAQLRGSARGGLVAQVAEAGDPWDRPGSFVSATPPTTRPADAAGTGPSTRPAADGPFRDGPARDVAPPPSVRYVEIIRGGVVSRQTVPTTRPTAAQDAPPAADPWYPEAVPPARPPTTPPLPEFVGNDTRPATE